MLTLDHEISHAQEDLLLQLRLGGCGSVRGRARAEHDLQNLDHIVRMEEEVQWANGVDNAAWACFGHCFALD